MNRFGRLLEKEIPRLRRYAFALIRNMSRADDLIPGYPRPRNCEATKGARKVLEKSAKYGRAMGGCYLDHSSNQRARRQAAN